MFLFDLIALLFLFLIFFACAALPYVKSRSNLKIFYSLCCLSFVGYPVSFGFASQSLFGKHFPNSEIFGLIVGFLIFVKITTQSPD